MGDPRGFLKVRTRRELAERPVEERIKDWFDVHAETGLQPWTQAQAARALKKHNPDIYIVAVEPASSPVLEGGEAAPHRIQGIGANFVPALYDASVVDEVIPVPDDEAIRAGRELASAEGLLAGISSGAAVYAARLLAKRPEFANKMVVALLPDTGERYLSTELFAFDTYPLE